MPKEPTPRRKQLANMPEEQMWCRVLNRHRPREGSTPRIYPGTQGGWSVEFICVCGTEVTMHKDRHGFRSRDRATSYVRPAGYLMEEGGRLTEQENAALFLRLAAGRER